MSTDINPFARFGSFASGSRFVGREEDLKFVLQQIEADAGASLVGQRKVGKTSLAKRAYEKLRNHEKFHPIFIDFAGIASPDAFYNSMSKEVLKYVKYLMSDFYEKIFGMFKENQNEMFFGGSPIDIAHDNLISLLSIVQSLTNPEHPSRFVFFIDEFDKIRLFDTCDLEMQRIRSLSEDVMTYGAIFILISRRTLLAIEKSTENTSPLGNIYRRRFIRPFSEEEAMLMIDKLSAKIQITDDLLKELYDFSGWHPYLLELALAEIWDYQVFSKNSRLALCEYFKNLQDRLSEDELWNTLVKVVIWGIHDDANSEAYTRLQNYGLIKADSTICRSWSPSLDMYITSNIGNMAFNEQWAHTERELRALIDSVMQNEFGSSWIENCAQAKKGALIKSIFYDETLGCIGRQKKEKATLGSSSSNLLDYTYTPELWQIIDKYWEQFRKYFKGDKKSWEEKFKLLGRYRNPVAHSNAENLRSDQRQAFYEIINDLKKICSSCK